MIIDAGDREQGGSLFSTVGAWLDGIRDSLPARHDDDDFDRAVHRQMLADLHGYSSAIWLCRYFYARAGTLREMAERNPGLHDDLVSEFVCQLDVLR